MFYRNSTFTSEQFKKYSDDYLTPNGRVCTWEFCYLFFQEKFDLFKNNKATEEDWIRAELELGSYLATYGMYRGSGDLMDFNRTVYKPVIQELFKVANNKKLQPYQSNIEPDVIIELVDAISNGFKNVKIEEKYIKPTKILTTKILMGVFACLPAFDSLLSKALAQFKKNEPKYSLIKLLNTDLKKGPPTWSHFAREEGVIIFFDKLRPTFKTSKKDFLYPLMRTIDLYFWFWGMDLLKQEQANKHNCLTFEILKMLGEGSEYSAQSLADKLNMYRKEKISAQSITSSLKIIQNKSGRVISTQKKGRMLWRIHSVDIIDNH